MNSFNKHYRFGSARWTSKKEIRNADLFFNPVDPVVRGFNGKELSVSDGEPITALADTGAEKWRDIVLDNLNGRSTRRTRDFFLSPVRVLVVDPRGEFAAVTIRTLAKSTVYYINPFGRY